MLQKKLVLKKFELEKDHQKVFNKLCTHFSLKEYELFRVKRYLKRLQINNLVRLVKNKKVVDFGCIKIQYIFISKHKSIIDCDKYNLI